jgi:hypothetical protein
LVLCWFFDENCQFFDVSEIIRTGEFSNFDFVLKHRNRWLFDSEQNLKPELWVIYKKNDCTTLDITFHMYSSIWTSKFQQLEYCMSLMINEWALLHGDRLEKKACKIGFFCLVIFWNETLLQGSTILGPAGEKGLGCFLVTNCHVILGRFSIQSSAFFVLASQI